jgi:dephospho-CoA kinase
MLTRIGITGGIGSGKSEVCGKFSALGITTISADAIARQLTDSEPSIRKKIIARFGPDAYDTDSGLLNRQYIAGIVFENRERLNALNSIVHPAVITAIEAAITSIDETKETGYVIVESALLFESRLNKKVDYILTVVADEALRIERVRQRDNVSVEQIRLRMANQFPVDKAVEASDFVLYNNDSPDVLHAKIKFFHIVFSTLKPRLKKSHESSR